MSPKELLLPWIAAAVVGLALAVTPGAQPYSLCELGVCSCQLGVKLECVCNNNLQEILVEGTGHVYVPDTVGSIVIQNCLRVRIASRSLSKIRPLRSVVLNNIRNLDLEDEAFFWNNSLEITPHQGIDIRIHKANIPALQQESFMGQINSIRISDSNITTVKPLAFANVAKIDRIEIIRTRMESVSPKSFSKFIVNNFLVEGSHIGRLPSYSMNSIEIISQLKFENTNFDVIQSSAFRIADTKTFYLRSCRIGTLEGEAFKIRVRNQIFIDDNIIHDIKEGAFVGLYIDPKAHSIESREYIFENNTLMKFEERALVLNTTGIKVTIDRIVLSNQCACSETKIWSNYLVSTSSKSAIPFSKIIWCKLGRTNTIVVYDFEQTQCNKSSRRINWALAGPIAVLIILIGLCSLGYWFYRKRTRRYVNVPNKDNKRLSQLVVPAPKTYIQTEMNVLTESAEPMKEYVAPQPAPRTKT